MKEIKLDLTLENYATASEFLEQELKNNNISQEIIFETLLVFEALYNRIIDQGCSKNSVIEISKKNRMGDLSITIGFEGKMFIPQDTMTSDATPEDKIMRAYEDKLSYTYHSSYNIIELTVKRGQRKALIYCLIGFVSAIVVYTILNLILDAATQESLLTQIVAPIEQLYSKAMLMVGAPMTFFSLIKNLMDTYIVAERSSIARKLQSKTIVTSIIAIVLGVLAFASFALIFKNVSKYFNYELVIGQQSFAQIIDSIVPADIFEPFSVISPFPIIVLAILTSYSLCSVGKHFKGIKKATDACYTFFSKMLNIVMYALPVFCFVSFLYILLDEGWFSLIRVASFIIMAVAGIILILIFYLVRLIIGKVDIKHFAKKLWPVIRENFRINSAIDAASYNTRYCVKNYGFDRKRLEESLPILAQTNLDGNCVFLMLAGCSVMFFGGGDVTIFKFFGMGIIIFFLSLGAPNQPGSILIGMLIILSYVTTTDMVCIAIYLEVLLGSMQNIVNVLGDLVTVAIEEARYKSQKQVVNKIS